MEDEPDGVGEDLPSGDVDRRAERLDTCDDLGGAVHLVVVDEEGAHGVARPEEMADREATLDDEKRLALLVGGAQLGIFQVAVVGDPRVARIVDSDESTDQSGPRDSEAHGSGVNREQPPRSPRRPPATRVRRPS